MQPRLGYWLLLIVVCAVALLPARAFAQATRLSSVTRLVGKTVYVTGIDGRTATGRLVNVSDLDIAVDESGARTVWAAPDIKTIEVRDSLANGALIGAGIGALVSVIGAEASSCPSARGGGCYRREIAVNTLVSAAVGAFIDWRRKGRTVIYRAP